MLLGGQKIDIRLKPYTTAFARIRDDAHAGENVKEGKKKKKWKELDNQLKSTSNVRDI